MCQYIHYGATSFDINKFEQIKNQEWGAVKPTGGIWASPVDAELGWKQWCSSENYCVGKLNTYFKFHIRTDAKICHIKSVGDLDKLPEWKGQFKSIWFCIDFEEAMKRYDAIELHLSEEIQDDWLESLYFKLYGWDCDSILIMNPEIIVA